MAGKHISEANNATLIALSNKLGTIANVRHYGAIGDGVTDDTAAINAALAANKIVLFEKKTYIINATLYAVNGQQMIGYGSTIKKTTISVDLNVTSSIEINTSGVLVVTVENNPVELAKLKIGMRLAIVNREGDVRKIDYQPKTITNINGLEITLTGNSTDLAWDANTASLVNCFPLILLGGDRASIEGFIIDGSKNSFIHTRTYWENNNGIGIYDNNSKNITIKNNFFKDICSDAIMGGGIGTIITNNTFTHIGSGAIHFSNSKHCIFSNNVVFDTNIKESNGHNEGAVIFSNMVYDTKITGNIFDCTLSGIASIDSVDNRDCFISQNVFYRTRGFIISSYAPASVNIQNIIITENRFHGQMRMVDILLLPFGSEAPEIPFIENTKTAILLNNGAGGSHSTVIISNNIFYDIYFGVTGTYGLVVTGNTFEEIGVAYIGGTSNAYIIIKDNYNAVFTGNTIRNLTTPARAQVLQSSANTLICGNYIESDKSLMLNSSNGAIIKNNILKCSSYVSQKSKFIGNTITGKLTVGYALNAASDVELEIIGNDITNSQTISVTAASTSAIIKDNILRGGNIVDAGITTVLDGNINIP